MKTQLIITMDVPLHCISWWYILLPWPCANHWKEPNEEHGTNSEIKMKLRFPDQKNGEEFVFYKFQIFLWAIIRSKIDKSLDQIIIEANNKTHAHACYKKHINISWYKIILQIRARKHTFQNRECTLRLWFISQCVCKSKHKNVVVGCNASYQSVILFDSRTCLGHNYDT